MSHSPQGPDKLLIRPVEGGQAGAGSTRDTSLARHAAKTVGHVKSHPAPTVTGPSHHGRYRHAQTHRHANGTVILSDELDRSGLPSLGYEHYDAHLPRLWGSRASR